VTQKKAFHGNPEFIIKKFLLLMQILLEKKRMNSGNSFIDFLLDMINEKRIFSFVTDYDKKSKVEVHVEKKHQL
jgi:hypothetical protein